MGFAAKIANLANKLSTTNVGKIFGIDSNGDASVITVPTISGAFRNLQASANGTSSNVSISVDEIVLGDGTGNFLTLRNWTGTLNSALSGLGGLDTGVLAVSTWYYIYAISQPSGTKSFLTSLSSTTPTLPVGYTLFNRIGAFRTDATGNKYPLAFKQFGRIIDYVVGSGTNLTALPGVITGVQGSPTTPTWVSANISAVVPPTAAAIQVVLVSTSGSINCIAAPNNSYGSISTITNPPPLGWNSAAGNLYARFSIETMNLFYASNGTISGLFCLGWEDNL